MDPLQKKNDIFVDLDGTLFAYGGSGCPSTEVPGIGHMSIRPNAHRFLAALRELGQVRVLTAAQPFYAAALNQAFSLGFQPEEIISVFRVPGTPDPKRADCGRYPRAVLIDDICPKNAFEGDRVVIDAKCLFLGFSRKTRRVVVVPAFTAGANDAFEENWAAFVAHAAAILATEPTPEEALVLPPWME